MWFLQHSKLLRPEQNGFRKKGGIDRLIRLESYSDAFATGGKLLTLKQS